MATTPTTAATVDDVLELVGRLYKIVSLLDADACGGREVAITPKGLDWMARAEIAIEQRFDALGLDLEALD